jgi:O-antigen ligase
MAAAFINGQVRDMGLSILKSIEAPSMQERYVGWKPSYHMFVENPILGVGPKCFMDARERYNVPSFFGQAHNMIIHTACEMGIVGVGSLISWIVFYIYFIATYRKRVNNPVYLGLWFGGIGYLVTLAIGGITEPIVGGEHSQLFMTLIGLMHVGLESNGKECQKSNIQGELV